MSKSAHAAELRHRHPDFRYESFAWELQDNELVCTFFYRTEPDLAFRHQISIAGVTQSQLDRLPPADIDSYVFHLGLAEMSSYWKLTASPHIGVEAGALSEDQCAWWHKLLIKGMGEYFFVNDIDFTQDNFVTIEAETARTSPHVQRPSPTPLRSASAARVLVPIGGGKDSALTLELCKTNVGTLGSLLVNPTPSAQRCSQIALGVDSPHEHHVRRQFDPLLFELNSDGYLNGHVPVSSVLAYISLLVGRLFDYTHVAISNEHSSNEANVRYLGHLINHQYSKSFEFERSLQEYTADYLPPQTPDYFSLLRPLHELQIAQRFAQRCQAYLPVFHSCNRGQKTDSWCGACPKCLFAFTILYPFLGETTLVKIFGKNLFEDAALLPIALELLGLTHKKPFECVGTYEETICAFHLCVAAHKNLPLPILLQHVYDQVLVSQEQLDARSRAVLTSYNTEHRIPPYLESMLDHAQS